MGDLSEHFSAREFSCYCGCGLKKVDPELIKVLEDARRFFSAEVVITPKGGRRCVGANELAGGVKRSQHITGKAADIYVVDVPAEVVQAYFKFKYQERFGIGSYGLFTHIDVREADARWTK